MMDSQAPREDLACLHAIVQGQVQGVGFRYFVQERAVALGLTGWVRNLFNGAVEVLAAGERSSLEKLVEALRRGPRASYVTGLTEEWLPSSQDFKGFQVRMTA